MLPSVLLRNKHLIPLYSIHDAVEPFDCQSDLNKVEEFYRDDFTVSTYGTEFRIEAAFYSSHILRYLLGLGMPITNIKYKILTRIFKGRVDFLLKRAKQGASVDYVGGFRGEAPKDIPFPWI